MDDNELRKLFQEMFGDFDGNFDSRSVQPAVPREQPKPQPAPRPRPVQPAPPAVPASSTARFFMKKFRGTVNYVENHTNEFFEEMAQNYPTFQVVSTSAVELPDSICMFITYRL